MVKWREGFGEVPPERCETERERSGGNGGKFEWKSPEVNTSAVSRGQYELIGKCKMAAGDVINVRG